MPAIVPKPQPAPPPPEKAAAAPDPIVLAIAAIAGNDARMTEHMARKRVFITEVVARDEMGRIKTLRSVEQ